MAVHPGAVLHNPLVNPPFDFKTNGRRITIVVVTNPQLEAVALALVGRSIRRQLVGIEIERVDLVGIVRLAGRKLVGFQIIAEVATNRQSQIFGDDIFNLAALPLGFIEQHG